jgi:hypothetical protein
MEMTLLPEGSLLKEEVGLARKRGANRMDRVELP